MTAFTIAEAGRRIAARGLSPVELVRACLDRIESHNRRLGAFCTVVADEALTEARAAEAEIMAGRYRGPLHGIPVGLKDAIDTAGLRTAVGSRLYEDRVPGTDAECWRRLKAAGAILLGKLENHEFCLGGPAFDALVPPARNPWNIERYAGGSSSGSGVAVAAGMCLGALGTDTGGSIRIPAALCGIAGIKPTYGRVSRRGVFPLSFTLDHVGPMAWTAEDCALMLAALAGPDPGDLACANRPVPDYVRTLGGDLKGLRIGHVRHFLDGETSPAIAASMAEVARTLSALGARVEDVTLPDLWDFTICNTTIMTSEAYAIHERHLREHPERLSAFTRGRIGLGAFLRASDYVQAQRLRRQLIDGTRQAMRGFDAIVCAGSTAPPPRIVDMQKFYYLRRPLITAPFNVLGIPAASVCCGFDAEALPLAFQVAARPFEEGLVLRIADAYERATPWRRRRPPP